jgi:hypothetical protein
VARYAAATEVSVEKSKAEIERTLSRYGASAFGYATEERRSLVQFKAHGRFVRFILPLPDPQEARFQYFMRNGGNTYRERSDSSKAEAYEQGCRQTWRALALVVKAKLEAVEAGIATFEDEFLAHTVLPNGETVSAVVQPKIDEAYRSGVMPTSLLALPAPSGGV